MASEGRTFGRTIADARKAKSLNQKELAEKIRREDGDAISPQYLNDIEHDRRLPSKALIKQFAGVLGVGEEYLDYLAGRIPDDIRERNLDEERFERGMQAFRKSTEKRSKNS